MIDNKQLIMDLVNEAKQNPYQSDSIGILFNNLGFHKFKDSLKILDDGNIPIYTLNLKPDNTESVLSNLTKLLPYQKGILLKLISPQKRKKMIHYINAIILDYIQKNELENYINIIHELTANSEKANLQDTVVKNNLADGPAEVTKLLKTERDTLLKMCDEQKKWVKISWKFTNKLFKVEVKNNTIIEEDNIDNIKDKLSLELNTIADGFTGEMDDKLGAGLGLFFVNFFKNEIKEKYDFESIFRIYQNDFNETVTSLTVMFEKN